MPKSDLSNFCLIENRDTWEDYKAEVASKIGKKNKTAKLEFPSEPETYPCLVATIIAHLDPDPTVKAAVIQNRVKIFGCFVYPSNAKFLLDACAASGAEVSFDYDNSEEETEENSYRKIAERQSELLTLQFAMLKELESIGAIKRDTLGQSIGFADTWLKYGNRADTLGHNTELLNSFWKEVDDNAR